MASAAAVDRELYSLLLNHANVLDASTNQLNSSISTSMIEHARRAAAADLLSVNEAGGIEVGQLDAQNTLELFCKRFSGLTGRLGISDYLARIVGAGGFTASSCVDIASILMSRLRDSILESVKTLLGAEEFDRQLEGATFVLPTPLVFRAALTALVLGIKLQSDIFHTLSHYSFAGGVPKAHLILMERDFLGLIEYNVSIPANVYRQFQEDIWASQHERLLSLCSPFLQPLPTTPPTATSPAGHSSARSQKCGSDLDEEQFEDTFLSEDASSVHTPTSVTLA
ncbi:cyclin, putative [Bodo saltans]|uniref:Cyclin, putative n=1 Tax=Bodo saltans TaxID=75058 RepID=A0A0S4JLF6_BODSA|nr:cyclin, putative [Bodo saltans]|eukprot:CUG89934.1 cyclin, putative [Bodo saltans]